jgi:hypothetical protein
MDEDEDLETVIRRLVKEKNSVPEDSARYRFLIRQLSALRYSRKEAGGIIEDVDPFWGDEATPLEETKEPEGQLLPLPNTGGSRSGRTRA